MFMNIDCMSRLQPAFVRPVPTLGIGCLEEFEFQSTRRESTPAKKFLASNSSDLIYVRGWAIEQMVSVHYISSLTAS